MALSSSGIGRLQHPLLLFARSSTKYYQMKTKVLLLLALPVFLLAQSGRTVTASWTDPNVGLTNPTYSVYKASGPCTGTPVFAKIASALTAKTYSDVGVPPGVYCYAATVTANSIESAQSIPAGVTVGPLPVTGITITVQ
jgi:hypothetical protein